MDIITPIDESKVGSIAAASKTDVEKAVQVAKLADQNGLWRKLPGLKRGSILRAIAVEVSLGLVPLLRARRQAAAVAGQESNRGTKGIIEDIPSPCARKPSQMD